MTSTSPVAARACVFDAYGTLLDFSSAAQGCCDVLGDKTEALTALWRDKQLQYTWLRALQGAHADFWHVTQDALDFSLEALGFDDATLRARLLDLYRTLIVFPEVPGVLNALTEAGITTAILSNGTKEMLAQSLDHAGISDSLDHVFSVDDVGVFKTDRRVYQLAVDRLGLPAHEIVFISANGWDAHAAASFGMPTFWCNRTGQPQDRLPGELVAQLSDLSALPPHIIHAKA